MMTERDTCKYAQCLCWLRADNAIPCVVTSMLPFGKAQKRKIALQRRSVTRSQFNSRTCRVAKLPISPPRSTQLWGFRRGLRRRWHRLRSPTAISCLGAFRTPAAGARG
jgi:hypothetical protein